MANPIMGAGLHGVGAFSSALCYTPQKKTKRWSWQTYWMAQASVCWLILPLASSLLTTPHLVRVLAEAPPRTMVTVFVLGCVYGIGGTTFGLAIRCIGFSVTYAVSIGLSCVLGTLMPPLLSHQLLTLLQRKGGVLVFVGVAVAAIGILVSGVAGRLRDVDRREASDGLPIARSKLGLGLLFAVVAGIGSAIFGVALSVGQPIADIAAHYGAGRFQGNVTLFFACAGSFATTCVYCLFLHWKEQTMHEYLSFADGPARRLLAANFGLAVLTGFLWYGQFFLYGIAHTFMGLYGFASWALHMAMLVFFSAFVGLFLREWRHSRPRTLGTLAAAFITLLAAVALITMGSNLAAV